MSAVPELDLVRVRRYCDARVPTKLRNDVRVEVGVRGKSVTIFECRPPWHPNLTEWSKTSVAQLRYDPDAEHWTLYCADRNSRWHRYDFIEPGTVDDLLGEIDEDPTGIFWG